MEAEEAEPEGGGWSGWEAMPAAQAAPDEGAVGGQGKAPEDAASEEEDDDAEAEIADEGLHHSMQKQAVPATETIMPDSSLMLSCGIP
jgi:hypothetical protein